MILNDKTLFKDLFIKEDVNSFMTTKKSSLAAIVKPLLEQKTKLSEHGKLILKMLQL